MKIVPYCDLENKDDILVLWVKSFGWMATADWFEKLRKYDSRLSSGPIGMCGIVNGELVGFVGIMLIPTRNRHGEAEQIGGIYSIATRSSHRRSGIGRKLLNASEQYMRENGIRLSMLTTSRAIVAHRWYCDVGYKEVESMAKLPFLYKILHHSNKSLSAKKPASDVKIDLTKVSPIFDWYTRDKCGFVIRNQNDLKVRELDGLIDRKLSVAVDGGYALLLKSFDSIQYVEILARSKRAYRDLLRIAESRARQSAISYQVFDPKAQGVMLESGYKADYGTFDVLMYKPLGSEKFSNIFDKSFTISRLNWF
ncbi:MAG: GNAT family N-acetyltransferase [Candidatus Zixiibacteriota bacterium]